MHTVEKFYSKAKVIYLGTLTSIMSFSMYILPLFVSFSVSQSKSVATLLINVKIQWKEVMISLGVFLFF